MLSSDQVNVLYCHAPDEATPIREQAAAMDRYHKEGKFAHVSFLSIPIDYTVGQVAKA